MKKSESQPKTEKIKVISDVTVDHTNTHKKGVDIWYGFCTDKRIPTEKLPLIKQAIESVLNDEPILKHE